MVYPLFIQRQFLSGTQKNQICLIMFNLHNYKGEMIQRAKPNHNSNLDCNSRPVCPIPNTAKKKQGDTFITINGAQKMGGNNKQLSGR